jgi:hypothetical protein
MEQQDNHIIDYTTFNEEQIEFYDEQQYRQARHSIWLEQFLDGLPYEMKTEL